MSNRLTSYDPELETFEGEAEAPSELAFSLPDTDEMELAVELLEVRDNAALRRLVQKVIHAAGPTLPLPLARALQCVLGRTLHEALGRDAGSPAYRPFGATLGSGVGAISGWSLGLELEGLSHEDREFEVARRLVLFAVDAVQKAAASPRANLGATAVDAVVAAARRYAPGLVRSLEPRRGTRRRTGRWVRRGDDLVVIEV